MNKFYFYGHAGSGNHGCEAIVRSTKAMIPDEDAILLTQGLEQDIKYGVGEIYNLQTLSDNKKQIPFLIKAFQSIYMRLTKDITPLVERTFDNMYSKIDSKDVAVSIGGDNYCYDNYYHTLGTINKSLSRKGIRTVLWGCSVEPKLLERKEVLDDMQTYSLITVRESLTNTALQNAGVIDNVYFYPDPAFSLETLPGVIPSGFSEGNTVGINISNLIQKYEKNPGILLDNLKELITHIIENTEMQIALIPHVVWEKDNDLEQLRAIFEMFKDTKRVVLVEDQNCMQLKGVISKCRFFIGARTHSTIAAYSSCVPTIALGYSIKAKGIATDIFGSYDKYVLPIDVMSSSDELTRAFTWMVENENTIKSKLLAFMPEYIAKSKSAGEKLKELLRGKIED